MASEAQAQSAYDFMVANQHRIQAVVDLFYGHELRTGHAPVRLPIGGKTEYICECGVWDVEAIMAEAGNGAG